MTRPAHATPLFSSGACVECDYPRTGLAAAQPCPECGTIPDPDVVVLRGWSNPGSMVPGLVLTAAALAFLVVRQVRMGTPPSTTASAAALALVVVLIVGVARHRRRVTGDLAWKIGPKGLTVAGQLREATWRWSEVSRVTIYPRSYSPWAWIHIHPRLLVVAIGSPAMYVRKRDVDLEMVEVTLQRWTTVRRSWF
jgi:hypothetical protein